MNDQKFDAVTRLGAVAVTRRTSLMTIGTTAFAALASSVAVAAKNNKNQKNKKKDRASNNAKQECERQLADCTAQSAPCSAQVEECTTLITAACGSDPVCPEIAACCQFLGDCDAAAFLVCLNKPRPPEDDNR